MVAVYVLKADGAAPVFSTLTRLKSQIMDDYRNALSAPASSPLHGARPYRAVLDMVAFDGCDHLGFVMKARNRVIIQSFRQTADAVRLAAGEGPVHKAALTLHGALALPVMDATNLRNLRSEAAAAAFESYDFGSVEVVSADGFEWTEPGDEMTRVIYIETESGEASGRGHFTVRFVPGLPEIAEAYATQNDTVFGSLPKG